LGALRVEPVLVGGEAQESDKALPRAVREAWDKAGFAPGWMAPYSFVRMFVYEPEGSTPEEVPGFRPREGRWKVSTLRELPAPARPFGLDLWSAEPTDADLKELR